MPSDPLQSRATRWAIISIVVGGANIVVFLVATLSNFEWTADWVAAIGTVGAVVAALLLFFFQRRADSRDASDRKRDEDLDETRRLVYMAMLCLDMGVPISPELGATLANALTHHSKVMGASDSVQLANDLFRAVVHGQTPPKLRGDLQNLARALSDRLGEDSTDWDRPPGTDRPFPHPDDPALGGAGATGPRQA